jgi:hypothetical protein
LAAFSLDHLASTVDRVFHRQGQFEHAGVVVALAAQQLVARFALPLFLDGTSLTF